MGTYKKTTFEAYDPWTATYLMVMDVPLIDVYLSPQGKIRWVYQNDNDAAWQYHAEWRNEENATVNGPAMMRAYREVTRRANEVRAQQGVLRYAQQPNA